jgi:outer membrane protein assembly factor BamB
VVCARAFQTAVGCVDMPAPTAPAAVEPHEPGRPACRGGDADFIFGADASDRVTRLEGQRRANWPGQNERCCTAAERAAAGRPHGGVRRPEGQVHFLSAPTARPCCACPPTASPVVGTPVLAGTTMLVVTRNGGLFAFRPE